MRSGDSELFEHGCAIHYLYDAQGVKLRKGVYGENGYLTEVLDYDGPVVYRDGAPDYILTGEGRLVFREDEEPVYEYFLADHLGNTRVTFRVAGDSVSVVQENHYYPFGLSMAGLDYSGLPEEDATQNPYLYNDKEFQGDEGLGWYDYGARFYDAQVGRFTGIDPIADTFAFVTPYNFVDNSPIANIDLWGLQAVPFQGVMATFNIEGYSKMVDKRNDALDKINFIGVSFSGSAFVGGGTATELNFSYVKQDGVFMNPDFKTGPGVDISFGIMFTIGYFSGEGKPTAKSTTGSAIFENVGAFGVSAGTSHDISRSYDKKPIIGKKWNFISIGFSFGSKTLIGTSAGVSYYLPVIYLYKEKQPQDTDTANKESK